MMRKVFLGLSLLSINPDLVSCSRLQEEAPDEDGDEEESAEEEPAEEDGDEQVGDEEGDEASSYEEADEEEPDYDGDEGAEEEPAEEEGDEEEGDEASAYEEADEEPDDSYLSELLLLAGDATDTISLTEAALKELGWTPGVLVADTTLKFAGMMDHAKTFSKNGKCIATFGATNDKMDEKQVMGGLTVDPIDFCGFKMHAGVVDEMVGFMKAPNWMDFIMYLNSPKCTSVTAVGHSLGGALATMFAGCANVGGNNGTFGPRKDYGLVVYAPFGISTEPIYSGTPGTPFVGRRYGITESDGGVSSKASLPQNTKQMRLDTLKLCVDLAKATGNNASKKLSETYQQFQYVPASHIETMWGQVAPNLVPFLLPFMQIALAPPPGLESFQPKVHAMLHGMTTRGELDFSSDVVSVVSRVYGYKHALVDFQPMANPNRPASNITYTKVVAAKGAAYLPDLDPFQSLFATMANGGGFPNHQICCYAPAYSSCKTKFTVSWVECRKTSFR